MSLLHVAYYFLFCVCVCACFLLLFCTISSGILLHFSCIIHFLLIVCVSDHIFCKAQQVCVDQRIGLYERYVLLLLFEPDHRTLHREHLWRSVKSPGHQHVFRRITPLFRYSLLFSVPFFFLFFSTETKFSRHLIFQPEDTTFTDNVTAGMLCSTISFESRNRATGGWMLWWWQGC